MNHAVPPDFTVSPYGPSASPRRVLFQPLLWLAAAVLAVVGPFLIVYDQTLAGWTSFNNAPAHAIVLTTDGWGHGQSSSSGDGADYLGGGPQYGILFCLAAALMLMTALWLVSNARTRYLTPTAPGLFGTALLAGSLAMLVVIYYPNINTPDPAEVHFRIGFYLEVAAVALGVVGGMAYRIGQFRADDPDRSADLVTVT